MGIICIIEARPNSHGRARLVSGNDGHDIAAMLRLCHPLAFLVVVGSRILDAFGQRIGHVAVVILDIDTVIILRTPVGNLVHSLAEQVIPDNGIIPPGLTL